MKQKLFIIFMLLLAPTRVMACSCIAWAFDEIINRADLVFVGKALSSEKEAQEDKSILEDTLTKFEIVKIYKGIPEDDRNIEVYSSSILKSCGIIFENGETYMMGVYVHGGKKIASSCSSRKISVVNDEVKNK